MTYVVLEKLMYLDDGYRGEFSVDGVPLLLIQENGYWGVQNARSWALPKSLRLSARGRDYWGADAT